MGNRLERRRNNTFTFNSNMHLIHEKATNLPPENTMGIRQHVEFGERLERRRNV